MERNIEVSKLPEVDEIDRAKIDASLAACFDKITRLSNNVVLLKAHFKDFGKEGLKKQHLVHLHLSVAGFELAAEATDWNLITALQEAISNIERETIKKMKK
tara:strand:+ start:11968 stop:12273 length:306 start_codon:yes stop_codon:yes gene_type:complete